MTIEFQPGSRVISHADHYNRLGLGESRAWPDWKNRGMNVEYRNLVCMPGSLSENQTRIEARGVMSRLRLRFSVRGFACFQAGQLIVSPNSPGGDFGEVFESSMESFAQVTKRMVASGLSPLVQHSWRHLHSGPVWDRKSPKGHRTCRRVGIAIFLSLIHI